MEVQFETQVLLMIVVIVVLFLGGVLRYLDLLEFLLMESSWRGELEFLLLQLLNPIRLILALGAWFLAEVHQEHADAVGDGFGTESLESTHYVIIK